MSGSAKRAWGSWALVGLATVGLAISLLIFSIDRKIAATGGQYTSFCNVNETVNCDVVLSSPYAHLLGIPVAVWAALTYAAFNIP